MEVHRRTITVPTLLLDTLPQPLLIVPTIPYLSTLHLEEDQYVHSQDLPEADQADPHQAVPVPVHHQVQVPFHPPFPLHPQ
jgi:hypothetical protein